MSEIEEECALLERMERLLHRTAARMERRNARKRLAIA